jgi:outer membrane protein assembly factor BamB
MWSRKSLRIGSAAALSACVAVTALLSSSSFGQGAPPAQRGWPQWRGPNRDGNWDDPAVITKFEGPQIPLRWRVKVSNGYSGPTVANGRVYLTDRVTEPAQQERVHCFDWKTGRTVWSHVYDAPYGGVGYPDGPRAAVTIDDGRAYSLGAVGHLFCFDAAKGRVLWSRDLGKEYEIRLPDWGVSAAPLIEGKLVIVQIGGSNGACLVALDRKTGKERWRALADRASYSAPIVIRQAGKRVLVCWTADRVVGLDPQNGKVHWEAAFPALRWPIAIATPVVSGDRLFLSSAIDGSLMLRLKQDQLGVEKLWHRRGQNDKNTDALHCLISTPLMTDGYIYGIDLNGELRCLDGKTGDRVWQSTRVVPVATWATAHLVRNGSRVWILNERGALIISQLSPKGYEEISRAQLIQPTRGQLPQRGGVVWSHPGFAYGHVFARNDEELVCASLQPKP